MGYQTKEAAADGFNYMAPTFLPVSGGTEINLQDIQLADTGNEGADIQVLDGSGLYTEFYWWYKKRGDGQVGPAGYRVPCPEGKNGVWFLITFDEDDEIVDCEYVTDRTFDWGYGIQLNIEEGSVVNFSGAVSDADVGLAAEVTGFNYYANPYPQAINLQDIQLTDTASESADIQVLDEAGLYTEFYLWYKKRSDGQVGPSGYRVPCPEGLNGVWFLVTYDEEGEPENYEYVTGKEFDAGDGFQLNIEEGSELTILAPFEL